MAARAGPEYRAGDAPEYELDTSAVMTVLFRRPMATPTLSADDAGDLIPDG
jgi:hypothetical protein